jgi:hypothetical protein
LDIILIKISIFLSLGLHKGRTSYRKPSTLRKEHPTLQNMKILYFFLYLWVIFAFLDPDLKLMQIRIQIHNPLLSSKPLIKFQLLGVL